MIRGSRGKYPYHEGKHLVAVLDLYAYADDSGLHGNASYCLLAGYIASPRQWSLFSHEWQAILKDFGVSDFHAKGFFSPVARRAHDVYRTWDNDKAEQFISRLTKVINEHRLYPLGCAVNVPDFFTFTIGERRFLTGGIWNAKKGVFKTTGKPSAPYFAAFTYFVRVALDQTPEGARLHLVFDRQNVMESRACNTLEEMIAMPNLLPGSEKLGSISYYISPQEPALQAADLYTYGWQDYCTKNHSSSFLLKLAMSQLTIKDRGMSIFNLKGIEDNLALNLPREERVRIQEQT
jgi:hypothetical protein